MKQQILNWFKNNENQVLEGLKQTEHTHSNGNKNPYHLEGDCLTHTMMVFDNIEIDDINLIIASILHDIGKIYTRKEKDTGKVSFRGHENVSMVYAIEIVNRIEKDFPEIDKLKILQLIAWHGQLWKKSDFKNREERNNRINLKFSHEGFYNDFIHLCKADALGRTSLEPEEDIRILEEFEYLENYIPFNKNQYEKKDQKNEVIFLIGLSGSGKSTWKDKNKKDYKIISIDEYLSKGKLDYNSVDYSKNIKKAHDNSIKDIKFYVEKEENVIIDMTNLTIEQRRKKLALFPSTKYFRKGIVFLTELPEIKSRLKKRAQQKISEDILNSQIEKFELPGLDEFNDIEYII